MPDETGDTFNFDMEDSDDVEKDTAPSERLEALSDLQPAQPAVVQVLMGKQQLGHHKAVAAVHAKVPCSLWCQGTTE